MFRLAFIASVLATGCAPRLVTGAEARDGRFSGYVLRGHDQERVELERVVLCRRSRVVVATISERGHFQFSDVPRGRWTLVIVPAGDVEQRYAIDYNGLRWQYNFDLDEPGDGFIGDGDPPTACWASRTER